MLCRVTKVSSTANNKVLFKIRIFPDNLHPVLNYITIYWYRVRPVAGPDGSSRTLVDARSWRNLGGDRAVRVCVLLLLLVRLFQVLLSRRCVRASSLRGRACGQKRLRARSDSAAAPRARPGPAQGISPVGRPRPPSPTCRRAPLADHLAARLAEAAHVRSGDCFRFLRAEQ